MLASGGILALYFWGVLGGAEAQGLAVIIGDIATIMAAATFGLALVSYAWPPKKPGFIASFVTFIAQAATAAVLIITTGGTASPFVALWMLLAVFAGVFGLYGIGALLVATLAFGVTLFLDDALTAGAITSILLLGILPLITSFVIWHKKARTDEPEENALKELATEFTQVSNESDKIINAIGDGVIVLNGRGVIELINPAATEIVGWNKSDALSLEYASVLKLTRNDEALTSATDPISQALATAKEMRTDELALMTRSGKKILVAITVSPVGQIGTGVIVIFRNITKEKNEEQEQAEFISTASHEMRTPVASIEGYLGLALNPATAQVDDKAREFITKAQESAQHLGRLFQDLLDISKAEDGRLTNTPKVIDVVNFTHDIVQSLHAKAESKQLRLVFKPQPDDSETAAGGRRLNPAYYTNVDNDHLREVLSNLVDNAIKYTPKGDVTVDIGGDSEHVVISVADTGIGIPKEDQGHLFQKFYRVDNSATREIGGTGLGLYLSRRLVEAMGGRIWLESEFQRGSTFFVELPRINHEDAIQMIETAHTNAPIGVDNQIPAVIPPPAYQQPAVQPQAPPQVTIQPSPQPAQPTQTAPSYQPYQRQAPQQPAPKKPGWGVPRQNTPLSAIEQNPSLYMRPRPGVSVPPRGQNQP